MCCRLFDGKLTDCLTGLKEENIDERQRCTEIQPWQPPSSHVHSSPMNLRSTSCFCERRLPAHQHLGFKSRRTANRRRKTNQTGFGFPFSEKQTWEKRVGGRNREREKEVRLFGLCFILPSSPYESCFTALWQGTSRISPEVAVYCKLVGVGGGDRSVCQGRPLQVLWKSSSPIGWEVVY